jgi:hypothetical protein
MKKIALISALAVSGLFYNNADAQIKLSLGLRLPGVHVAVNTPVYADYNAGDDYYYLPDVDAYYSVAEQCYYYNDGNNWISAAYLPGEYRNYDWRNARNYEVRAHRPYLNADVYRERYRGNVNNWGRNDNHYDNRTYANRDNRGDYRNDRQRFDNRNDQRDSHEQGTFTRPSQQNRSDNNYSQPNQSNRGQGNYNHPSQGGRNQSQPARGQEQPTRQNGNSQQQRGNNAGGEHFTDNHDRNGHDRFKS